MSNRRRYQATVRGPHQKKTPKHGSSHFGVFGSARLTDVRQLLRLRLPFVFKRLPHGKLFFTLDVDRLPSFLDVTSECISSLRRRFCPTVPSAALPHHTRVPIDYAALQQICRRMLAEGPFSTQTELARHLGVSRVWVGRVLKGVKRQAD